MSVSFGSWMLTCAAVAKSHLHALAPDVLDRLLAGAVRNRIPAGSVFHWAGEPGAVLELVISGLVRIFVTAPDGRTMTVRYCRPGALMGVASLFAVGFTLPAANQPVVDSEVLRMSPTLARHMAERDGRVAMAFLGELSERVRSFIEEIPGSAFATVRQRVSRHLLDLAVQREQGRDRGAELIVPVSQQELADAVGTVREVVVRVLRELRQEGLALTERDQIVILDPARLVAQQGWNPGS
jgi:CRP/FNR family cyclic AMP-dependent transcriptional regulator